MQHFKFPAYHPESARHSIAATPTASSHLHLHHHHSHSSHTATNSVGQGAGQNTGALPAASRPRSATRSVTLTEGGHPVAISNTEAFPLGASASMSGRFDETGRKIPGFQGSIDEEGRPHGFGTQKYSDKSRYEGQFFHGELHGHGSYRYASGATYVGHFVHGKRHGQGKYQFTCGTTYEGDYFNDKRHGRGRMRFSDAAAASLANVVGHQDSELARLLGTPQYYEGEFADNVMSGRGTMIYTTGARYVGMMSQNIAEGDGVIHLPNGEATIHGQFSNGLATGSCVVANLERNEVYYVHVEEGNVVAQYCGGAQEDDTLEQLKCSFDPTTDRCPKCGTLRRTHWLGSLRDLNTQSPGPAFSSSGDDDHTARTIESPTHQRGDTGDGSGVGGNHGGFGKARREISESQMNLAVLRTLWEALLQAATAAQQKAKSGLGMAVADCVIASCGPASGVSTSAGPKGKSLRVVQVAPRSPAANCGLGRGDYIWAVNGAPVKSAADFGAIRLRPGDDCVLTITHREARRDDPPADTPTTAAADESSAVAATQLARDAVTIKVGCTLRPDDWQFVLQCVKDAMQALLALDVGEVPISPWTNEQLEAMTARLVALDHSAYPRAWPKSPSVAIQL